MIVALLGDVHGNSAALSSVLDDVRAHRAEHLLVTGDLVGYYYDVPGVVALLDEWPWTGVRGNHEEMLDAWRRGEGRDDVSARYGSALAHTCATAGVETIDRLVALPHPARLEIGGRRVLLCHGTPSVIDRYVYPDAASSERDELVEDAGAVDVVVYGHTHHPVTWRSGLTSVVNPGSVGQPRDRIPGACWVRWDTTAGTFELRRVEYDCRPLVEECRRRDPDLPYLADVLMRVR